MGTPRSSSYAWLSLLLFCRTFSRCNLCTDLVHVELANRADHGLELVLAQCAGLLVHQDTATEAHNGGDGGNARSLGELTLGFGVNLAENDVAVLLRSRLIDGGELLAGTAPICPEIQEDDVVALDGCSQVLLSNFNSSHEIKLHPRDPNRELFALGFKHCERYDK